MIWRHAFSLLFAAAYLVWIWRNQKAYSRVGTLLCLAGSIGISIDLACEYVRTLPSSAPLRTVSGLATDRTSNFLSYSHSEFVLIEAGTGSRTVFTTQIKGPWLNQPIRATYVDDGQFMPSVVRIEILNESQFPWIAEKGHAGWIGSYEAKRRPPLLIALLGLILMVAGALAPAHKVLGPAELDDAEQAVRFD